MKQVYIAHPLGGGSDREQNRANASKWVAWAGDQGVAPTATWIILSGEWDESKRELGLEIDKALVARCDELWLVGGRVSAGMAIEAKAARDTGVSVRDLTYLGALPPTHFHDFGEPSIRNRCEEPATADTLRPEADPFSAASIDDSVRQARAEMPTLPETLLERDRAHNRSLTGGKS